MTDWHPLRSADDNEESPQWLAFNKEAEARAKAVACAALPSLDHLSRKDFEHVYEPAEDTYLLLDALQSECQSSSMNNTTTLSTTILEIGCGSGVASIGLALALQARQIQCQMWVTDINPRALQATQGTARANSNSNKALKLEAVQCDLISALLPRMEHTVDVLIFNPPYVPTPDDEVCGSGIEASWAGGTNGRRVIDRAIPQIARVLSKPHGVGYVITVDDNQPEQLSQVFYGMGIHMQPLLRRRANNEYLSVQKLTWRKGDDSDSRPDKEVSS